MVYLYIFNIFKDLGNEYTGEIGQPTNCRAFVWGLNDKDQLGGMKGSKVKLPVHSEFISQLCPVHIAGGSKSLFIVSQEGKVCRVWVIWAVIKNTFSVVCLRRRNQWPIRIGAQRECTPAASDSFSHTLCN